MAAGPVASAPLCSVAGLLMLACNRKETLHEALPGLPAPRPRPLGAGRGRRADINPGRGLAPLTHAAGVAFFDTALGVCGVAWNSRGIAALQLPEARAAATRRRLRARFPEAHETAPPASVRQAIDAIVALLSGGKPDLSLIVLDMEGVADFDRRVYEIARSVPPGMTTTYGAIAGTLGEPGAARAVGQALGRNPFPIVVPCHRVLATGGQLGGFSAADGVTTKLRILAIEGADAARQRNLFD